MTSIELSIHPVSGRSCGFKSSQELRFFLCSTFTITKKLLVFMKFNINSWFDVSIGMPNFKILSLTEKKN